jgi:hypothetical protein
VCKKGSVTPGLAEKVSSSGGRPPVSDKLKTRERKSLVLANFPFFCPMAKGGPFGPFLGFQSNVDFRATPLTWLN